MSQHRPPEAGLLEIELHKAIKQFLTPMQQGRVMGAFREAFRAAGGDNPAAYAAPGLKMLAWADSVKPECVDVMIPMFYAPAQPDGQVKARMALSELWEALGAVSQEEAVRKLSHLLAHFHESVEIGKRMVPPVDWMMCERIGSEEHVDEALRVFSEDATQDNATGAIQAALTVYLAGTDPQQTDLSQRLREKVVRGTHPDFTNDILGAADEIERLRNCLEACNAEIAQLRGDRFSGRQGAASPEIDYAAEAERRRPGITAFKSEVMRAMAANQHRSRHAAENAKVLFTSNTLDYRGTLYENPHIGGKRVDLLDETIRSFFLELYPPANMYTEIVNNEPPRS